MIGATQSSRAHSQRAVSEAQDSLLMWWQILLRLAVQIVAVVVIDLASESLKKKVREKLGLRAEQNDDTLPDA